MRKLVVGAVAIALASTPAFVGGSGAGATEGDATQETGEQEYVVLYSDGASADAARAAISAAGGTIVTENTDVGVATVTSTNADFQATANAAPAIEGTAENRVIGSVPDDAVIVDGEAQKFDEAELETSLGGPNAAGRTARQQRNAEPLAWRQWDMEQIGATPTGSYRHEQGSRKVLVGVIDTGVDGTHPDIAPNFDAALSRNFTVDIPKDANGAVIDGPCEYAGCVDPNNVDDDGHGTHVASTIASPINGIGIAGVAPKATIVNLRAGQDSGYFFLQPSIDALTYAGNNGIDVVNMSYYVDPWLFNCVTPRSDTSAADLAEQQTIVAAMQRALDYAYQHDVTLVSAAGNGATDYTKVIGDASSPDFASSPGERPYARNLLDPASCISMPSEGNHVISVSSTGPSTRKAYYSDYGNGYIDVAAPGGDAYDNAGNVRDLTGTVLAAFPEALARANGWIGPDGRSTVPNMIEDCSSGTCAYYQYLQGTSMASPHAVGVAALIISRYGTSDRRGGRFLAPDTVQSILQETATETPCPTPPAFTYLRHVPQPDGTIRDVTATHVCEGGPSSNGFYGSGIVNAMRAIGR